MNEALFAFDQCRREKGFLLLAGVDEAGRGPWAGPVAAAAVVLKPDTRWPHLNDSKKLSPSRRESLFIEIKEQAHRWAIALVGSEIVDRKNILQATFQAMTEAVESLESPSLVLVDGNQRILGLKIPQETVVKGDGKSASIAAASVLAKVARDRWMMEAHQTWPEYDFASHKGYGTPTHMEALRKFGPCPIHRKSFAPIRALL